jgi:hypothetical protein
VVPAMDRLNMGGGWGRDVGPRVRCQRVTGARATSFRPPSCALLERATGWTRCAPWLRVFAFRYPCPSPTPLSVLPERGMRLPWVRCEIRSAPSARGGLVHICGLRRWCDPRSALPLAVWRAPHVAPRVVNAGGLSALGVPPPSSGASSVVGGGKGGVGSATARRWPRRSSVGGIGSAGWCLAGASIWRGM